MIITLFVMHLNMYLRVRTDKTLQGICKLGFFNDRPMTTMVTIRLSADPITKINSIAHAIDKSMYLH